MRTKLAAMFAVVAAAGAAGVATAPSASAHWADACQYKLSGGGTTVSVMCPKSTPGVQFSLLATCSNGVKKSSPMTLQGNWTSVSCAPYTYRSGQLFYR
jgi:hypothetical protein